MIYFGGYWVLGFIGILGLIKVSKFIVIMKKTFMITFIFLGIQIVNPKSQNELCSRDVYGLFLLLLFLAFIF